MIVLLLAGCTNHTIDTQNAVIETKGWPIVAVHIEGPGGDRTTVPFEVITETAWAMDMGHVASIVLIGLICWGFKVSHEIRHRQ